MGASWDLLWRPFCDCSAIWDAKLGGSFQVHVFSDPGMEMMPECIGWMCYNHDKNCVCLVIHFFYLFSKFVPGGMILGVILTPFGDLGVTFSGF